MRGWRRLECFAMEELIDALAETPKALAQLVADASDELLDDASDGGWSARTILAHFRDDEYLCTRVALERMLAQDVPDLAFIDGADWEPTRNRTRDRKAWLLADFALQRQATLGILRMLRREEWERAGLRDGTRVTVRGIVEVMVRHDREHLEQLERAVGETLGEVVARRAQTEQG